MMTGTNAPPAVAGFRGAVPDVQGTLAKLGEVAKGSGMRTQLLNAGRPPLLMEPVEADIQLKGPPIKTLRPVDLYGVPTDRQVEHRGNVFTINGRHQAYYYQIKR